MSGLVSVMGGPEGHFAIVARSLSIPTLVGVKNLLKDLNHLKEKKIDGRRIRVITALAANQGLKEISENIQDLNIYCACIDPELISESELSPGIGDPSLRIKTRVTSSH